MSADDILKYFLLFFKTKIRFVISCKLSPEETVCIKCQILFSRKYKKKYSQFVICWISIPHSLLIQQVQMQKIMPYHLYLKYLDSQAREKTV